MDHLESSSRTESQASLCHSVLMNSSLGKVSNYIREVKTNMPDTSNAVEHYYVTPYTVSKIR